MSGSEAGPALKALTGKLPPPRVARHVRVRDPGSGEGIDDGLALWFPGPRSVTGEDVAELHLHGSRAVLTAVMAALGRLGLRLAEPGEFTRRAFQGG
ncbi:MAG TPA: tRNA uridine-5-carboxymethylaminomethyl(34) synthesis GTPase MnmE, partial [Stellaceae bacterium]|nr:tRNA uridine-5-carboxymethylaminomethyl(34) synthesis GTPase MnmE [Stellaceae bacterium]